MIIMYFQKIKRMGNSSDVLKIPIWLAIELGFWVMRVLSLLDVIVPDFFEID